MLFRLILAAFAVEMAAPAPAHAQPGLHVVDAGAGTPAAPSTTIKPVRTSLRFVRETLRLLALGGSSSASGGAAASGTGVATAKVAGPVVFEITVINGDIVVKSGAKHAVEVRVSGKQTVSLQTHGKRRMTAELGLGGPILNGDVWIELPRGSDVVIESINGDVTVGGVGGDAQIEAVSGDVTVKDAGKSSVSAVNGDVSLTKVAGDVTVETVSGNTTIHTVPRADSRLRFDSTSGSLAWFGLCGNGCRIEAQTLAGNLELHLDANSSFDVVFEAFSGGIVDKLGLGSKDDRGRSGVGRVVKGRYGKGAGKIDVGAHSGDLLLVKK